ncbi:MAG: hypothetical protein K0R39_4682 [Symbiobacteriaceae bacterium]|nr:hypothetical protein [Symbiobacteriaceae bacterium]
MPKSSQVPSNGQDSLASETRQVSPAPSLAAQKIPQIPLVANLVNSGDKMTRYRNMLDACMKAVDPADATLSALVSEMVAEASQKNHLGTLTPSQAVLGLDDSKTYLFIIPAPPKTPGVTPLKYRQGQILVNLYQTFAENDRLVRPDVREYYDVFSTPGEVTIQGVYTGWGVYVDLSKATKEPIKRLSEEEKAARAAKAAQTKAAKAAKQKQEESQAPTAESENAAE